VADRAHSLSRRRELTDAPLVTSDSLADWSLRFAEILSSLDDAKRLPPTFLESLGALVPSAYCYVTIHPLKLLSEHPSFGARPDYPMQPLMERFLESGDPIEPGCFALRYGMPKIFWRSELYRQAYVECGYVDEINHFTSIPSGGTLIVGILRSTEQGTFSDDEIALHESIHPLVAFVSRKLAEIAEPANELDEHSLDSSVAGALEQFGEAALTPREHDVIKLALLGNDTQSTADRLGISRETVKIHRKHAYAKLRVGSQGELFAQFLASTQSVSDAPT
jgi:DNA-binding CsgD family transcriptional regulator